MEAKILYKFIFAVTQPAWAVTHGNHFLETVHSVTVHRFTTHPILFTLSHFTLYTTTLCFHTYGEINIETF